jgi:hypothetical protein
MGDKLLKNTSLMSTEIPPYILRTVVYSTYIIHHRHGTTTLTENLAREPERSVLPG